MSQVLIDNAFNNQIIDEIIRLDYERLESNSKFNNDIEDITLEAIEKTLDYYYSLINNKSTESNELQKYKNQFDNMKNTSIKYFNDFNLNECDKQWFFNNCIFKRCIAIVNLFNKENN